MTMSLIPNGAQPLYRKLIISFLFSFLFYSYSLAQTVGINGTTTVTLGTSYSYLPTFNGSFTTTYNGSYSWIITGGVITGTSNTTKSGTCSGALASVGISVTWSSTTGTLKFTCSPGNVTITITGTAPLSAGTLTAPSPSTVNYGAAPGTITGTAATGGFSSPTYTYQWYSSPDNSTWTSISGATSQNYTPGALFTSTYFRRMVTETHTSSTAYTTSVWISVWPQISCIIAAPQTITLGSTAAALTSSVSGGNSIYTYLWKSSPDNSTWTSTGVTTSGYSPGALSSTTYYEMTATSNGASVTSSSILITVNVLPAGVLSVTSTTPSGNGSINQLTCTPSGGNGTYTYVWYCSTNGGSSYSVVSGATSSTYTTGVITATTLYYVAVSSITYTTNSNTITLTVPSAPSISASQTTLCNGATATLTATGGSGNYKWYNSSDVQVGTGTTYSTTSSGTFYATSSTTYGISGHSSTIATSALNSPVAAAIVGNTVCALNSTEQLTDATTGGVWSSSNSSVLKTDLNGLLTGKATGAATITYTLTNACGTSAPSLGVNVIPFSTLSQSLGVGVNDPVVSDTISLIPSTVKTTQFTEDVPYSSAHTIKNAVALKINEETPLYIPGDFTARVVFKIEYGHTSSDIYSVDLASLSVSYNKDGSNKYNSINYFYFRSAEFTRITIDSVQAPTTVGGVSFDTKQVLLFINSLAGTRYYTLADNMQPALSYTNPSGGGVPDELTVNWVYPAHTDNNYTQLEWTWLENDLVSTYQNGPSFDTVSLFKNGATRVDLPGNATAGSYNIPLFYNGTGKLFVRARGVNLMPSGSRSDGPWSNVTYYSFGGHNTSLNWQVRTTFAEEGKHKTVMQYYDGTLRERQTVTKDNSLQTTVVAETMYDAQGRPAVQILPTPGISSIISYTTNLNKFNTQVDNTSPLDYFDFTTTTSGNYSTCRMDTLKGTNQYYSSGNPALTQTSYNKNIPAANGYAYAVTRYTPDATGRIMMQSGVGDSMRMGTNHVTRYYYGTPAREEIDALFGTEVGDYTHYFKNMVQDPNGQMSVSYVDMHGRTIATALAGESPASLQALNITDTTQYKNQAGKIMSRNLLDSASNSLKGNSIESVNSLLVPSAALYNFQYNLSKQTLRLPLCNGDSVTYKCKFDLQIAVHDESGDTTATIFNYTGIDTINFQNSISLLPGSYSVRKTLTINQDSLAAFLNSYDTSGVGICQTQQFLADSVAALDSTASGCNITPANLTCSSCLSTLGSYSTYLSNYATSLGDSSVNQLSSSQQTDIRNQFLNDSSFCASLNGNISHTLETIRKQMLTDMISDSGQYARMSGSGSIYNAFNIYSPSGNATYTQPFYKYPRNESLTIDNYYNEYGQVDSSVIGAALYAMSDTSFEEAYRSPWASSLLPYHPEFSKLKYAENNLTPSYNFMDSVNQTVTTAFSPVASDPFFTVISTTTDKSTMKKYSDTTWQTGYSMWQLAYGDGFGCKLMLDTGTRNTCYNNMPKQLTTTGTSVNTVGGTFVTLSSAIQSQAWSAYLGFYSSVRNDMVNRYINSHADSTHNSAIVSQGYKIYFPNGEQQRVADLGWGAWYPAPGDSVFPKINLSDSAAAYSNHCAGYINAWQIALMNCPALDSLPSKDSILNLITSRMQLVCQYGTDGANPFGSSSVSPAHAGASDTSFEEVVKTVLTNVGISEGLYCNPYYIEYPKPYNKNVLVTKQSISAIDTCNCSQFTKLKTEITGAGYNIDSLSSINRYLLATYQDTISAILYQGLQNCGHFWETNCHQTGWGTGIEKDSVYYYPIIHCDTMYSIPLASPQPFPQFLTCGFSGSTYGCYSCANFKSYDSAFYNEFHTHPDFTDSVISDTVIAYNNLFAEYLNFKTGLQHDWLYYANQFRNSHCNIGGITGTATALSICLDRRALNDTAGFITPVSPCLQMRDRSTVKAALIYDLNQQQLIANFNTSYLAKCLAAKETFNVTDTIKEYHYTLYYYDQAGNLIKTIPPKGVNPIYRQTWIDSVESFKLTGTKLVPNHCFATRYCYNSLNLVNLQKSPDGGVSKFWYDRLGRLALSQNAKQGGWGNFYSYTQYDALGRIMEVGQINSDTAMTYTRVKNDANLQSWFTHNNSNRSQIVQTGYDLPYGVTVLYPNGVLYNCELNQENLRNRVSYVQKIDTATNTFPASATYYSYDVHGNVDTLLQDFGNSSGTSNVMNGSGNRFKKMSYDFDLISGKVNQVSYQVGHADAYYQRYNYDAENRLTDVYSGKDSIMLMLFPEREAHYSYYAHGPLARTDLGQLRVQGLDYAYTLQGWMKGINPVMGGSLSNGNDTTEQFPVSQDVYGFSLHYYSKDYRAIGYAAPSTGVLDALTTNAASLFNGNIAAMAVNIPEIGNPLVYNYHYDQLNRIVAMDAYQGLNDQNGTFTPVSLSTYQERVSYDPNGNILKYNRHGDAARISMDSLTYTYKPKTNQLDEVADAASDASPTDYPKYNDIKQGQSAGNYQYDAIGNLISDNSEGITNITWNVYGKIASLTKSGQTISYTYDASGNRTMKATSSLTTAYVRDATGNVMSVYTQPTSGALVQSEMDIYGSSRLGMATQHLNPDTAQLLGAVEFDSLRKSMFTRGEKLFELSNHLGNVLVTIDDRRIQKDSNADGTVDTYAANISSANDYYPFGMTMPGRNYTASSAYRYGFNGQEKSDEIDINTTTAQFWEYDARSGRRWNLDPKSNPSLSSYSTFSDNPVFNIDILGDTTYRFNKSNGNYIGMADLNAAGQIGSYGAMRTIGKGKNKQELWNGQYFNFADDVNDPKDIRDGIINKLVFVSNNEIKDILTSQGAFNYDNKNSALNFYQNSKGGQPFDYSYSTIPDKYGAQGASSDPLITPSRILFLPEGDNTAHNHMNFGNYLWGASGFTLGFSFGTLQAGAHVNSLLNFRSNNYSPQWDSPDDQNSIKKGAFHALQFKYRTILELRHQAEIKQQSLK